MLLNLNKTRIGKSHPSYFLLKTIYLKSNYEYGIDKPV